jgi:hypothetical protein
MLQTSNIDISSAGVISGATGITSSGIITFTGLNCTGNTNGGALTANGSGVISCSDDDGGSGASLFTDVGSFTYLISTNDDLVLGATSVADGTFYHDVSTGALRIGSTGTTDIAGSLIIADLNGHTLTLSAGDSSSDIALILPTSVGSANQCLKNSATAGTLTFSNCNNGSGAGGAITLDDAYEAGNDITTSDNRNILFNLANTTTDSDFVVDILGTGNAIQFQDSGTSFLSAVDGGAITLQNTTNSVASFSILNAGAVDTLFTADTTNNRVIIGNQSGTDGSTTLLVIDSSTSDPTGGSYVDGSIYYDSDDDIYRCRINGAWTNCDGAGTGITSFSVAGSTGTAQTITNGNTLNILAGSSNITSVASNTDVLTIDIVNNPTFMTSVTSPLITSSAALGITGGTTLTLASTGVGNDIVINGADILDIQDNTTFAGTVSITGVTDFTSSVALRKGIDVSATTLNDQNFGEVSSVRLTGSSTQTLTGIANGRDGELLTIINAGTTSATISNESGSSSANNRILTGTGASISVAVNSSISLIYDSSASRWRVIGDVAGGASSGANTSLSNIASTNLSAALNVTSGNLNVTTTTSGNIVVNSAGTIELQDNTNVTGNLDVSGTLIAGTADAFQVSSGGAVIAVGVNAGAGLLQGSLGLTVTGAAINLNASSNFAVNIGTGTSTGAVSIGGGSNTFALNSNALDISTAGIISGATGITSSGTITFSGLTASRTIFTDASSNLVSTAASAALLDSLSDETGTGVAVFGNSPSFSTSVATGSASFDVFNTTATTINAFGATTTLNIADGVGTRTTDIGGVTASGTDTVNIATNATAADTISIGSTNTGSSAVFRGGGSSLTANNTNATLASTTINLNSATIATNQATVALLNTIATTVNAFGATTALTLGATTGGTSIRNALTIGTTAVAGSLRISDGTSNTIGLLSPSIASDYNLTLPTTVGSANECLKNSSTAGILTFGDCDIATDPLQTIYNNDVDGSDAIIVLTAADDSLIFRNPAASGTDSGYTLRIEQLSTGAIDALQVTNSGTGDILELQDSGTAVLRVADGGHILGNNSATVTTGTTESTARTNVTTVTTTAVVAGFANNDIIFIDNAGQDYYTRIVSGAGTTSLTVSPAVSYDASITITEYQNVINIGATQSDYTTQTNRFFQGLFLGGVVTGAESTILSDGNLTTTSSSRALILQRAGGSVGIGTSSPSTSRLDVVSATSDQSAIRGANSDGSTWSSAGQFYNSATSGTVDAGVLRVQSTAQDNTAIVLLNVLDSNNEIFKVQGNGRTTINGQLRVSDGSATAPSINFSSATNQGLGYVNSADGGLPWSNGPVLTGATGWAYYSQTNGSYRMGFRGNGAGTTRYLWSADNVLFGEPPNDASVTDTLNVIGTVKITSSLKADGGVYIDGLPVIDGDAGWVRTYGSTGWYNGTYGLGLYAANYNELDTYGDADFDVNGGNLYVRESGSAASTSGASGNYTRIHNLSGNGYIDSTASIYLRPNGGGWGTTHAQGTLVTDNVVAAALFRTNATTFSVGSVCRSAVNGYGWYEYGNCSSLARYKDNVQNIPYDLNTIRQLRPVKFQWNIDTLDYDIGFIAEEITSVDPIFGEYTNGISGVGTQLSGVKYNHLTALAIKGIQQLDLQVQNHESRLVSLESRLYVLESGNFSGSLSVINDIYIGDDLSVVGDTAIHSDLTVSGTTIVQDITVNGKIITAGNTPTATLGASTTVGQGGSVTIEGNDTAGSISYTAGTINLPSYNLSSGGQVGVVFDEAFITAPRIVLTPKDSASADIRYYVETTTTGFVIHFTNAPSASTQYSFNYIVIQ